MTQETAVQNIKKQLKSSIENENIEELKRKPMHGKFYQNLERPSLDKEKSLAWLCGSGLKGEMESLIIAAEDQVLSTHYHQRNIMKQPIDCKCRMCCKAEEHIKHIVAGCTTLAPSEYTSRLNKMAGYIHWTTGKPMGLQVTDKYCEHVPERVINFSGTTIMWGVLVITDQTILTTNLIQYSMIKNKKRFAN